MANPIVSDFDIFINIQLQSQEKVESCLWKLEALLTTATMAEDGNRTAYKKIHFSKGF